MAKDGEKQPRNKMMDVDFRDFHRKGLLNTGMGLYRNVIRKMTLKKRIFFSSHHVIGMLPTISLPNMFSLDELKPDPGPWGISAVPGHVEASKVLLSHGAQLDSQDEFLMTPLATAVKEGQALTWHRSCPVFFEG